MVRDPVKSVRMFQEFDIRDGRDGELGIDAVVLRPTDRKIEGACNRILNFFGFGQVYVEIAPTPQRLLKTPSPLCFKVSVRSATKYLVANRSVLCALGIMLRHEREKEFFLPEDISRIVSVIYKFSISEREKLQYTILYWKITHSPELLAYLTALEIPLPKVEDGNSIFKFMIFTLFTELNYAKERCSDNAFHELKEKIEKKFFAEHLIRLMPAVKEAVRQLRLERMPGGDQQPGFEMIHLFLADLSDTITGHLASLPKSLRTQFDRLKLLAADEVELIDFAKVLEYRAQCRQMERQWQASNAGKPLPRTEDRSEIVMFVDAIRKPA